MGRIVYRDGDDGPWSSFALRLGNPAQVVRVLPSTSGTFTTVIVPLGCNTTSNPSACDQARGGIFDPTKSKTWQDVGTYGLGMESNLGFANENGDFGIDSEGFTVATLPNLTYPNQIIAGTAANNYYLGTFGLGTQPTNFTVFSDPHPSFFTSLKNNNNTPSFTWSYTAGAPYRKFLNISVVCLGSSYDHLRQGLQLLLTKDFDRIDRCLGNSGFRRIRQFPLRPKQCLHPDVPRCLT